MSNLFFISSLTIIEIMKFYIYNNDNNAEEMLANMQRFVSEEALDASIYSLDQEQRQPSHEFVLTPALFLDDHLLIEGDTPTYDELSVLIKVAVQFYVYSAMGGGSCGSGGCSSGSCGSGGCGSGGCGSSGNSEEECGCGGNCSCGGSK